MIKIIKRLFSGHFSIGPLTVYGNNAMHWGVILHTKKYGYVCFRLPFKSCGRWWPLYLYFSPNATPWAATFLLSHIHDDNWALARLRCKLLGHNFNVHKINEWGVENYDFLYAINNSVGCYMESYYKKAFDKASERGYKFNTFDLNTLTTSGLYKTDTPISGGIGMINIITLRGIGGYTE